MKKWQDYTLTEQKEILYYWYYYQKTILETKEESFQITKYLENNPNEFYKILYYCKYIKISGSDLIILSIRNNQFNEIINLIKTKQIPKKIETKILNDITELYFDALEDYQEHKKEYNELLGDLLGIKDYDLEDKTKTYIKIKIRK